MFRRHDTLPMYDARNKRPLKVVGDAAIADSRIINGRLVPLLIVDMSDRSDLLELIRLHEYVPPGDVRSGWAAASTEGVSLALSFSRPVKTAAVIEFELPRQGILVDQILATKVLYLQGGVPGDRYITNPAAPPSNFCRGTRKRFCSPLGDAASQVHSKRI